MLNDKSNSHYLNGIQFRQYPVVDVLLLLIFFLTFFREAISSSNIFFYMDHGFQNIPFRWFASVSLKQGIVPLWCPYSAGGFPFFAEGQSGFSYFINWFFYLLLPFSIAYNWSLLTHLLFWGYGHYVLFRVMSYRSSSAVFGAISLTFCGYMIRKLLFVNYIQCLSFLPWILVLFCSDKVNSKLKTILVSIIIALQWFTGHPQAMIISLTCFWLFILFSPFVKNKLKMVGIAMIATVFGTLLAGWQLLPTVELVMATQRFSVGSESLTGQMSLPPSYLPMVLLNHIFGSASIGTFDTILWPAYEWELSVFLGLAVVFLALMAGFGNSKQRFYWSCVSFGFCLAVGPYTPLYTWISKLPVYSGFRASARWSIIGLWGLSALAVHSLDLFHIMKIRSPVLRKKIIKSACITGSILFTSCYFRYSSVVSSSRVLSELSGSIYIFFITLITLVFLWFSKSKNIPSYAFIILVCAELYWGGYGYCALGDKSMILEPPQALEYLDENSNVLSLIHESSPNVNLNWHEKWSLKDRGDYPLLKESLPMYSGMIHQQKVITFNEWSPLHYSVYKNWSQKLANLKQRTIENFHLTHILTPERSNFYNGPLCKKINGWELRRTELRKHRYDARTPVFVDGVKSLDFISMLTNDKFTVLRNPGYEPKGILNTNRTNNLSVFRNGNNRISIANPSETGGIYVIDSVFDHNWQLKSDKMCESLELIRADGLFLGLLFSGEFSAQLEYMPLTYRLGLFVSLFMTGLLICFSLSFKSETSAHIFHANAQGNGTPLFWIITNFALLIIWFSGMIINTELWLNTFYNWLI